MMTNVEIRELFETGKKSFESKHYPLAEQCFLKILRTGGQYADALNMLGIIYHAEGKFNDAIESFRKAIGINPLYLEASLNLAVLYNDLGEYTKAKELYKKIQEKKKGSTELNSLLVGKIANMHAQLGDTYRDIKRYDEAIDEYKKALALCPQFTDIRTKLGLTHRENKQTDLAIRELTHAIGTNPAFQAAHIQLGLAYFSAGKKDKAAGAWRALLKKNKDHPMAQIYLRLCK